MLAGCPPLHFDKNDKIEEGKDGLQMLTQNGDKKRKEKEKQMECTRLLCTGPVSLEQNLIT